MKKPDRITLKTDDLNNIALMAVLAHENRSMCFMGKSWICDHYSTHPPSLFGHAYRGIFELVECQGLPGPNFIEISG